MPGAVVGRFTRNDAGGTGTGSGFGPGTACRAWHGRFTRNGTLAEMELVPAMDQEAAPRRRRRWLRGKQWTWQSPARVKQWLQRLPWQSPLAPRQTTASSQWPAGGVRRVRRRRPPRRLYHRSAQRRKFAAAPVRPDPSSTAAMVPVMPLLPGEWRPSEDRPSATANRKRKRSRKRRSIPTTRSSSITTRTTGPCAMPPGTRPPSAGPSTSIVSRPHRARAGGQAANRISSSAKRRPTRCRQARRRRLGNHG